MNTRKYILTIVSAAAATAVSLGAVAQVPNPDNDSATFFKYVVTSTASPGAAAAMPAVGELSRDGLYVYTGSDCGWENRSHSFVFSGGQLAHTADCLAYDTPKPVVRAIPAMERGVFGDHAA